MLTIVIWHQFHYSVHGQCLGIKEGISRRESVFPLKKGQMIEGWTFHSSFCFMSSNHSTNFNRIHQTVLVFTDSSLKKTVRQPDFHGRETKGYHIGLLFAYLWLHLCVERNHKKVNLGWASHCGDTTNYDHFRSKLIIPVSEWMNSWYK